MWFAAMSSPGEYPWVFHLIWKLLHNDSNVLGLFASNPFPDHPPRHIRAVLYRYFFAKPENGQNNWWNREKLGLCLPPLSADNPRLVRLLRRAGWLSSAEEPAPHPSR
ncbi:MAG: lipase maturation factor family protein, partial [Terrimicrobiaceae bacterium]